MADLAGEVRELFEARNFAHLATTLPDGSPHSVPVWMRVEDGKLLFFTQTQSRKARNLQRDPRVAISITDERNPYRSAWVRGRVVQRIDGDAALQIIDRISQQYTGADFPMRSGVVHVIEPEQSGHVELPFSH
ncbi:MAG: PPOX class F420-dependent oxidoreductase [Actinobacteria bacterium]|nr:MAG: PPOX class F420-dependent oxidoreductase [Actinomycetota bacterium]